MDVTTGFLIYAALYRLAIVAAGALAIWLGYRLFIRGVARSAAIDPTGAAGTDASAEIGGFRFTIGNAAPGTCFALFGAALIVAMTVAGSPALEHRTGAAFDAQTAAGPVSELRMKGSESDNSVAIALAAAAALVAQGSSGDALYSYRRILSTPSASSQQIANAAAGVANVYLAQNRSGEALTLARFAVQVHDSDPHNLDILAAAARAQNEAEEAAAAEMRAAELRAAGLRNGLH